MIAAIQIQRPNCPPNTVWVTRVIPIWIVWGNTDTTEGRGISYPIQVCALKSTAIRLSKGQGVMGSDASIEAGVCYEIDGRIFGVTCIDFGEDKDKLIQESIDKAEQAISKAKSLGMSDDEIKAIQKL